VHLVDFIVKIYDDARSPERQTGLNIFPTPSKFQIAPIFLNETFVARFCNCLSTSESVILLSLKFVIVQ